MMRAASCSTIVCLWLSSCAQVMPTLPVKSATEKISPSFDVSAVSASASSSVA